MTTTAGPNTGFRDALEIIARLIQRSQLTRLEVEDVIRANCRRQGKAEPEGTSMRRRVERLKSTLDRSGLPVESSIRRAGDEHSGEGVWRFSDMRSRHVGRSTPTLTTPGAAVPPLPAFGLGSPADGSSPAEGWTSDHELVR